MELNGERGGGEAIVTNGDLFHSGYWYYSRWRDRIPILVMFNEPYWRLARYRLNYNREVENEEVTALERISRRF